jgi:transketolase
LGAEEIKGAREKLGWNYPPFEIPADILSAWLKAGERSLPEYKNWKKLPKVADVNIGDVVAKYKAELIAKQPKEATRQSSGNALEILCAALPQLVGGSADLTGSNLTKTKSMKAVTAPDYSGTYIYYGIREHGMAAIMNGIALHGGFIPYSGTFLVFTDYCRPAIRLSALMGQRVIYVMTHDSIGLGEDGPTHQPVEHLASLRAIPNLLVMRPADAVETLECWQIALESTTAPSILALSRQAVPCIRKEPSPLPPLPEGEGKSVAWGEGNLCAKGAYILSAGQTPKITIMATGTEIAIAIEAQAKLKAEGIEADVVSMPCFELFDAQPEAYKKSVLRGKVRVAIEAAIKQGWEKYLSDEGVFIGMEGFGASAPAPELYKQFGITSDNVVKKVKERLKTL